jgi:glycerophosphoryl diester phosphodiesterase
VNLPRIIGHRGAAGHAPENTLISLRTAATLGARCVEFDIHLSSDGVPVLLHDDTLDRTTNGKGPVAAHGVDQLRTLDAGSWFGDGFAGERLPTLEDAIRLLAQLGLGANVEIKPSPGTETDTGYAVGRMLREQWPGALPPPLISSFALESLAAARAAAPGVSRALLVRSLNEDWARSMRELDCRILHCREKALTASAAEQVLRSGFRLNAFTVNDKSRAERLFGWGVGSVISDYPERLL